MLHGKWWSPVVLLGTFALGGCSATGTENTSAAGAPTPGQSTSGWFGGYFDVTLAPGTEFHSVAAGKATTILAFITADPARPCAPSWGGALSLEEAGQQLQLDAQIRKFRAEGNDIAVSFGGQRGQELASECRDAEALADAYAAVITRYELDVVDLDIEGQAAEPEAARVRAEAMARLQGQRPQGRALRVWLTLPVSRDGLDRAGKHSVEAMLDAGVELAGVNIMTMNFGPLGNGESMLDASRHAAEATQEVLEQLYSRAGKPAEAARIWRNVGLTPMIGDNDVEGNTFSLRDAAELNSFAIERGAGRISLWSINRDTQCRASIRGEQQKPSSHCSGMDQGAGDFTRVLSNGFTGSS